MGDNPYKYCNLQWEIIHTLLSCDNIFVHVLYVFSLVLFCLLMIVQCLDFKSIKLLLLLLSVLLIFLAFCVVFSGYACLRSVSKCCQCLKYPFLIAPLGFSNI